MAVAVATSCPSSNYERIESRIGEGTYGKIHKARDRRTGEEVAIKKSKALGESGSEAARGIGISILREIKVMQVVRHPNVMGCRDIFVEDGDLQIVMDFMDGDLRTVIKDIALELDERHIKCMAIQILSGLAALHQESFLHRDLAPGNVLLHFGTGIARIADFGMTRSIAHPDRPLTARCCTLWYRAPELLYEANWYGSSVDIWSVGCILAELFLRKALFPGRGEMEMIRKIFETIGSPSEALWPGVTALPKFFGFTDSAKQIVDAWLPGVPNLAQDLIDGGLLAMDPEQRPSAKDALNKRWFKSRPEACQPGALPFVTRK